MYPQQHSTLSIQLLAVLRQLNETASNSTVATATAASAQDSLLIADIVFTSLFCLIYLCGTLFSAILLIHYCVKARSNFAVVSKGVANSNERSCFERVFCWFTKTPLHLDSQKVGLFINCIILHSFNAVAMLIRLLTLTVPGFPLAIFYYGYTILSLISYTIPLVILLQVSFVFIRVLVNIQKLSRVGFILLQVVFGIFLVFVSLFTITSAAFVFIPNISGTLNLVFSLCFFSYFALVVIFVSVFLFLPGLLLCIELRASKSQSSFRAIRRIMLILVCLLTLMAVRASAYYLSVILVATKVTETQPFTSQIVKVLMEIAPIFIPFVVVLFFNNQQTVTKKKKAVAMAVEEEAKSARSARNSRAFPQGLPIELPPLDSPQQHTSDTLLSPAISLAENGSSGTFSPTLTANGSPQMMCMSINFEEIPIAQEAVQVSPQDSNEGSPAADPTP